MKLSDIYPDMQQCRVPFCENTRAKHHEFCEDCMVNTIKNVMSLSETPLSFEEIRNVLKSFHFVVDNIDGLVRAEETAIKRRGI
jgi:hypothetical protein